jgi:TNF receptor-associated protein 1
MPRFFSSDKDDDDEKKDDSLSPPTTEPPKGGRRRRTSGVTYATPPSMATSSSSSTNPAGNSTDAANKEPPQPTGPMQSMDFQAETRQLLDIVTNSLYTDKEVFLRELVSNASDALEKLRHVQSTGQAVLSSPVFADDDDDDDDDETKDEGLPLEIIISADSEKGTLTITDTGIGLTKEEMIENLGTIARSGSKSFLNQLKQSGEQGSAYDASRGIIGKFGVGFYSAFMVGEKVEVRSRSAYESNAALKPAVWSSDGAGTFHVADLEDDAHERGTSIVIHLKEEFAEFADRDRVELILKKYSNFVNFPIWLNGDIVNVMEAVWAKDPKDVDDETYSAFYKFIANAFDEPIDKIHFRADAPIDVKALFYIPSFHSEKYGMDRMTPGVSLYSRKVLIESKSPDIVPDWMRFVKGVVDSEDLPLSVSREKAQDSALIEKLRKVLTRKFISHLTKMCQKDPIKYKMEFYKEFGFFLKEGICRDFEFQDSLAKILFYETSKGMRGDLMSFDEYIARCKPEQKEIYYLHAPNRDMAVQSPYLEAFEKAGIEVIFVFTAVDEFVMANLEQYEGRKIVGADKADIKLPTSATDDEDDNDKDSSENPNDLSETEIVDFCAWFRVTLGDRVKECKPTTRLGNSPAVVTDAESGAMRRMMRMVDTTEGGRAGIPLQKQIVEVNMKHPIIVGIHKIREKEPTLALVLAEQVFDNCLIAAGLMDDGRSMLPRLNDLLTTVIKDAQAAIANAGPDEAPKVDKAEESNASGTEVEDSESTVSEGHDEHMDESVDKEDADIGAETPSPQKV